MRARRLLVELGAADGARGVATLQQLVHLAAAAHLVRVRVRIRVRVRVRVRARVRVRVRVRATAAIAHEDTEQATE